MDKKYFVLHVTNMGIKKNFAIFAQLRKMSKKKMTRYINYFRR
jgi:hypothetical protein